MKGIVEITLKSDFCAASGNAFSLSIDTDVCADDYGFPVIPARRLKGIFRENAELIECAETNAIFGVSGSDKCGALMISDARLKNYPVLIEEAKRDKLDRESVLKLFTSVKAATAIDKETGSAEENSLRFTRVVNHYFSADGENYSELAFLADVDLDEKYSDAFAKICKATRHIGYKRNRGYGAVKIEFKPRTVSDNDHQKRELQAEETYEITYALKLRSPLMIAGASSDESLDYIPGTSILGAFAGKYLKNAPADEKFEDIFIKNNVVFDNLYITENGTIAVPAPAALGKTKTGSEIKVSFFDPGAKEIVKPFKSGFIIADKLIKVNKETVYHNPSVKGSDDHSLYMQTCVCEGQVFAGKITGKGKYLSEIYPLLEGEFRFGRSKTAQYSKCSVIFQKCEKAAEPSKAKGDILYGILLSDLLLLNEFGSYSEDISDLKKELERSGNIEGFVDERSSMRYKTVMGYVSAGRFKKPHIPAFAAGSVIAFKAVGEFPAMIRVGERQGEGYGKILFCDEAGLMKLGFPAGIPEEHSAESSNALNDKIAAGRLTSEIKAAAVEFADKYNDDFDKLKDSFIGRVLLMLREAENFDDFQNRLRTVKDEKRRETAIGLVKKVPAEFSDNTRKFLAAAFTVSKYRKREGGSR